jgi:hypothetical protein
VNLLDEVNVFDLQTSSFSGEICIKDKHELKETPVVHTVLTEQIIAEQIIAVQKIELS